MPGKFTEGYTKSAQNSKFVRHRDIKMKESELKREAHIQKVMCEGVCRRCREKVQWRFKFDKYKPLKNIANCQGCKQKCVTKAYRTLCDKCGTQRNICPGCCGSMDLAEDEAAAEAGKEGAVAAESTADAPLTTVFNIAQTIETQSSATAAPESVAVEGEEEEDEGEQEEEEEEDEEDEEEEEGEQEEGDSEVVDESLLAHDIGDAPSWNEKKFKNVAASKYSKHRKVGDASDTHYY